MPQLGLIPPPDQHLPRRPRGPLSVWMHPQGALPTQHHPTRSDHPGTHQPRDHAPIGALHRALRYPPLPARHLTKTPAHPATSRAGNTPLRSTALRCTEPVAHHDDMS